MIGIKKEDCLRAINTEEICSYNEAKKILSEKNIISSVELCHLYSEHREVLCWCAFNTKSDFFQVPLFKKDSPIAQCDIKKASVIETKSSFIYGFEIYHMNNNYQISKVWFLWNEVLIFEICEHSWLGSDKIHIDRVIKKSTNETVALVWSISNKYNKLNMNIAIMDCYKNALEDVQENPKDYYHEEMKVGESFSHENKNYQLLKNNKNVLYFEEKSEDELN